jgi:hypothetical protein
MIPNNSTIDPLLSLGIHSLEVGMKQEEVVIKEVSTVEELEKESKEEAYAAESSRVHRKAHRRGLPRMLLPTSRVTHSSCSELVGEADIPRLVKVNVKVSISLSRL